MAGHCRRAVRDVWRADGVSARFSMHRRYGDRRPREGSVYGSGTAPAGGAVCRVSKARRSKKRSVRLPPLRAAQTHDSAIYTMEDSTMDTGIQVTNGMTVRGSDGDKVGKIVEVSPTYIVVEKGFFFPSDHYIPTSAISSVGDDEVYLSASPRTRRSARAGTSSPRLATVTRTPRMGNPIVAAAMASSEVIAPDYVASDDRPRRAPARRRCASPSTRRTSPRSRATSIAAPSGSRRSWSPKTAPSPSR